MTVELTLKPFQRAGVEFLESTPRCILGDDPGLGKTPQAIVALETPALVVASARLLGQWREEVERWRPEVSDGIAYTSYASLNQRDRRKMLPKAKPELLPKEGWGTVVFDEGHALKGRSSMRTKAAKQIARKTNRMVLLTGTPIPNWSHELFQLLQLIDPDEWPSFWRWVDDWFKTWDPPWGGTQINGLQRGVTWEDFAEGNRLGELMLRRERDEVLTELPPLTEQTLSCPMERAQARMYRELAEQYIAWAENGVEVSAWSAGGLHAKLAQLGTGLEVLDEALPKSSGKLSVLAEMMEDRRHDSSVVFTKFRRTAIEVQRRLTDMGIESRIVMGGVSESDAEEYRKGFQAGEFPVLIGTLDTIGEGFTLHRADTAFMVERSWRPSQNEQAKRRIHRMGQERPCLLVTLVTTGTIDDGMTKLLASKTDQQIKTLRAAEFVRLLRG